MQKLVQVIEEQEKTILFECPLEEIEKAYEYATQMEQLGIETKILAPSLPESLAIELGAKSESIQKLRSEIDDEIGSHIDEGCSLCLPKDSSSNW